MSEVHTKVYLIGTQGVQREIRRAAYSLTQMHAFPSACAMVKGLFGLDAFRLEYEDNERDRVILESQEEWEECLRCGPYDLANPLKLFVTKKRPATKAIPTSPTAPKVPMSVDEEGGTAGKEKAESSTTSATAESPVTPTDANANPALREKAEVVSAVLLRHVDSGAPPAWLAPALKSWQPNGGLVELDVDLEALEACLSRHALDLMDLGDNATALTLLRDAHSVKPRRQNSYNMACCLALLGHAEEAMQALEQSVALGYSDHHHLVTDPDLASLRSNASFMALAARLATPVAEEAPATTTAVDPVAPEAAVVPPTSDAPSAVPVDPTPDQLPAASAAMDVDVTPASPSPEAARDTAEWENVHHEEAPRNPARELADTQQEALYKLHELGFTRDETNLMALEASGWNLRKAIDLLLL